ncbi:Card1-like endonuclease domain-containing protein [Eubacterium multiforme]|uniref:Holliday junction resolvase n=1 Tax=Eubacterium multiforme TaxID=83339 RepID=A0ABT9UXD2_9FIRM|nr:DUF1887 family CARF protein [Eubacterium multiforme]MDQ0150978.1 Holliday junction resolvase [Eubacterium multiforme]
MVKDTLITLVRDHNESGVILAKKYKIKNIILVANNLEKDEKLNSLRELYKGNNPNINVKFICDDINKILLDIKNSKNNIILNLTLENTLEALKILYKCREFNIDGVYVDVLNKREYWFKDNLELVEEELIDLYLEDMFKASGNDIISKESQLTKDNHILEFSKLIYENIDLWNKYKQILYDTEIFYHDYDNTKVVVINESKLNNEVKDILNKILYRFENLNLIKINRDKNIQVTFLNDYLKGFIFKSGTWLEVLTESIVKNIKSVDEVKSGVVFLWNKPQGNIKNELDVVAVKDSILVCISCKDSSKYDESTLNELEVYSNRIGGEKAKKILIATKKPNKSSIIDRAKEMGIHLIILNKDINKFKEKLEDIISKS